MVYVLADFVGDLTPSRAKGRTAPSHQASGLHCRICPKDFCEDLTATMCGHLFCNRCVELIDRCATVTDVADTQLYHRGNYCQSSVSCLFGSYLAVLLVSPGPSSLIEALGKFNL